MQSAIMTGSFSQGFEQSKIARQTNVVKCCHCESSYSPQNFQFYYCCEPFKLDKLFCHACKGKKFACLNCRYRQQTIVIQPKNLGKLDEQYFKKAKVQVKLNKGNNSKTHTITINSQHDRCFNCSRNFRNEKIQSYCHRSCNQKICFPCLFEVFYQQNKMFAKDSVIKKNYRMLMSCCETEGQKIMEIESLFKDNVCVFCGVCDQASQQWFIKIQKKICFCNQCYFKQRDRYNSIVSVENVLDFILKNSPKNCNYCEQPLKLHENMKHKIIYFNAKHCRECSIYLPKKQQQISQFLINYLPQKASIIETEIKQLQTTECSQCKQRVVFFQPSASKSNRKSKIQFDLIKWKNKKYYCSICLYFKYEKLRKQFENKRSKIMPVVTEQQVDRLSILKTIYQNHFNRRCLICSKQQGKKQSFIILNKKTKPIEWDNLQLACRFCKRCADFLTQQPERYNRLKNIKLEMERRDPNFLDQLQSEKQQRTNQWDPYPLHLCINIKSRLCDFWQFTNSDKLEYIDELQLRQKQQDKKNSASKEQCAISNKFFQFDQYKNRSELASFNTTQNISLANKHNINRQKNSYSKESSKNHERPRLIQFIEFDNYCKKSSRSFCDAEKKSSKSQSMSINISRSMLNEQNLKQKQEKQKSTSCAETTQSTQNVCCILSCQRKIRMKEPTKDNQLQTFSQITNGQFQEFQQLINTVPINQKMLFFQMICVKCFIKLIKKQINLGQSLTMKDFMRLVSKLKIMNNNVSNKLVPEILTSCNLPVQILLQNLPQNELNIQNLPFDLKKIMEKSIDSKENQNLKKDVE